MFKVECVGCQAPYQVDERRVPAKGLQMRCPKCGTSFRVEPNGSALGSVAGTPVPVSAGPAVADVVEAPRPVRKLSQTASRDALARTMIGMTMPSGSGDGEGEKVKRSTGFRMPRPGQHGGEGAPAREPFSVHTQETLRELPAVLGEGGEALADGEPLEQGAPGLPRLSLEPAAAPRQELSAVTPPPPRGERLGLAIEDLPEPVAGASARARGRSDAAPNPFDDADLPAALAPASARPEATDAALPLPISARSPRPPVPRASGDLPVVAPPRQTVPRAPAASAPAGAGRAEAHARPGQPKMPPPRRPRKPEPPSAPREQDERAASGLGPRLPPPRRREPSSARGVVDLPARVSEPELELPVVGSGGPREQARAQRASAPASSAPPPSLDGLDLPEVVRAGEGSAPPSSGSIPPALPALPSRSELPAVLGARGRAGALDVEIGDVLAAKSSGSFEPELPAVLGGEPSSAQDSGLPAVLGAELPSPLAAELPSPLAAELPSARGAELPAIVGGDLPAVLGGELPVPSEPGLPELSGQYGAFGEVDLPTLTSAGDASTGEWDLPVVGGALPALPTQGRGDADLPVVGGALPALPHAGLPAHADALPAVQGAGLPAVGQVLPSVRQADLPAVGQILPDLREPDLPVVGEILPDLREPDLPLVGQVLPATKPQILHVPNGGDAHDLDAAIALSFPPPEDLFAGGDAFTGGDIAPDGGGLGYGEVEIGDTGEAPIATADDMEFSALPQRDSGPPEPPRAAAFAAVHDGASPEEGSTLEVAPMRAHKPQRSRRGLVVAGVVSLSVIAGGALALVPEVGPFGMHLVLDRLNRDRHEQLLAGVVSGANDALATDTLDALRGAIRRADDAAVGAVRYAPLKAYAAYLRYYAALRFGPLPDFEAAARALVDGHEPDAAGRVGQLALAARAAASAQREAVDATRALGDDADAQRLLGELLLAQGNSADARAPFQKLVDLQKGGAHGWFGLARVALAARALPEARAAAQRALEANSAHLGAKILLLELALAGDAGAGDARHWVSEISPALANAAPAEAALAQTLFGELHLGYKRLEPAQKAFEQALQLDRRRIRALLGLGEVLYRSSRHAEALARFKAAAEAEPASLAAQLGVAKSQLELGRAEESRALLTKLAEQHPKRADVVYWTGRVHQSLGASQAALDAYRSALSLGDPGPERLDSYLALARLQSELGELAAAGETLAEAQSKLPASPALLKALGEIELSRGRFEAALGRFQTALALDASDTHARFLGAVALTRLSRYDEALGEFLRVSEMDKDFPGLALERGRLFEDSGRTQEALEQYEAALARAPEDVDLKLRVGCIRVVAGLPQEAESLLQDVLQERPRSGEVYHCLGRAALQRGSLLDALRLLERAVVLNPDQATYHLYVGWVANELGRTSTASAELGRALELDKGLGDAYWQRGALRRKQGATRDAIRDLKRALELKPSRHEAYAELAICHTDLGQRAAAIDAWEKALAAQPENALWLFRYGKLLSSGEEPRRAAAPLAKAIAIASKPTTVSADSNAEPAVWLSQAHYLLARTLGNSQEAVRHWQSYLRLSSPSDPYRSEAEDVLRSLGQPWDPR